MARKSPDLIDEDDPRAACAAGLHDMTPYDAEDGSVRMGCHECSEPGNPEILEPAPPVNYFCICGAMELTGCGCNITPRQWAASRRLTLAGRITANQAAQEGRAS